LHQAPFVRGQITYPVRLERKHEQVPTLFASPASSRDEFLPMSVYRSQWTLQSLFKATSTARFPLP